MDIEEPAATSPSYKKINPAKDWAEVKSRKDDVSLAQVAAVTA